MIVYFYTHCGHWIERRIIASVVCQKAFSVMVAAEKDHCEVSDT